VTDDRYACQTLQLGWTQKFYEKTVGAVAIPDSSTGIWKDWLDDVE